jgi:hypothetical protein
MSISSTLERLHGQARRNVWMWLFSVFCRLSLALGFIPAAIVKLIDERFASGLHAKHPMGYYLEALHYSTGFYYTFIGIAQLAAAVFLLIPRTATLGAFIYFPIILNITVLTYATRFDGSLFTAPLMTLANLYVLAWNYEKWKYILPFNRPENGISGGNELETDPQKSENGPLSARLRVFFQRLRSDKFPALFFAGVLAAMVFFVLVVPGLFTVKPHNTFEKCLKQFDKTKRTRAGENFCGCIHKKGEPLHKCLGEYNSAPADDTAAP